MITATDTLQVSLPGAPASVREARAFVRETLCGHASAEAAAVCVSELVTNAITHTRSGGPGGKVTVAVQPGPDGADICVWDAGGLSGPTVSEPPDGAEHGRGLRIVDALAAEWGTRAAAGGRVVWCRVKGGM